MDVAERIAQMEKELADLKRAQSGPVKPHEHPVEVTCCVIAHNDEETIIPTLKALWNQGVRMDLLLALDNTAYDLTRAMFEHEKTPWYFSAHKSNTIRECRYIGEIPHQQTLENTLAFAKHSFLENVQTPYVWFLDADVVLDAGTIRACIQKLLADGLDAVVVDYTVKSDHSEQGAMLMKTPVAKDVGFDGRPDSKKGTRCVCMNLAWGLAAKGYKLATLEKVDALHLKWR